MTFLPQSEIKIVYSDEQASLANGGSSDSGFIDTIGYAAYQVVLRFDDAPSGVTLTQEYKLSESGDVASATFPITTVSADGDFTSFSVPVFERFIRLQINNNTGGALTNFKYQIKLLPMTSNISTVNTLASSPVNQSQALLTQSVLIGKDAGGTYRNNSVNQAGAILTSDFKEEVARGLYEGYTYKAKFGRNPDVDTTSTPEDIYNGGATYTGFNATANEEIAVTSASAADTGSLISSGTATGGSNTTLIDTGATFVTDGVAVGDAVLNDTQGIHGIVTAIDSETQVTVFQMVDGVAESLVNVSGDAYRIARATGTGCGVLRLSNILDEDYVEQTPVYVIMNGTTTVTTSGVNAIRCPSGRSIISGSNGKNVGQITVTQAVTTANVFCVIPTFGSTTIGCFTVPAGKDCLITKIEKSITRSNGAAGSATITINVRRFGQSFVAERVYELNTAASTIDPIILGPLPPATDVKGTVEVVSDNNTVAEVEFEYILIDR